MGIKYANTFNSSVLIEKPVVSIVVPAFYEEGNLHLLYIELLRQFDTIRISWELVIVDDGSKDNTWGEIIGLYEIDRRVKGIKFSRNFGHQYALFAGLNAAVGKAVITMDADLQHPPEIIPKLIKEWQNGYKIVKTIRIDHESTKFNKKITSKWFYKIFGYLSGVNIKDGMADFRLMDEQVIKEFLKFKEYGLFLRGLVEWLGFKSTNVEYKSRERIHGNTKYNFRRMIIFAWTGVISFSIKPLRLATILGIITSIFSFVLLCFTLYEYFVLHSTVPGWATLMVVLTFLFGILFIVLGVIGEYIGYILIESRGRPRFVVSEKIGNIDSNFNSISYII